MKWVVEYEDAAAGLVRYDKTEIEAASESEARKKFDKETESWGPGICIVGVEKKETQ